MEVQPALFWPTRFLLHTIVYFDYPVETGICIISNPTVHPPPTIILLSPSQWYLNPHLAVCRMLPVCSNAAIPSKYESNNHATSQGGVAEGHQRRVLLVEHDVEQAAAGQPEVDPVDVVVVPVQSAFVELLELLVAGLDDVGGHIGVEVVDVVVLDAVAERTEERRNVEEGAALEGRLREVPLLLPLAVGLIH